VADAVGFVKIEAGLEAISAGDEERGSPLEAEVVAVIAEVVPSGGVVRGASDH
jgi:hypothetical protein